MADLIVSTLTQGLIFALLSYGVYITYSVLDFPDLTVDSSFPLGAAVTAILLLQGVNPWVTLLCAAGAGAVAGLCTGLIFRAVRKVDRRGFASYVVGAVSAPLLNTVFYMGLMCLIFYNCEYVQNLVASTGAANPILLVLAVVGVQGVIEVLVCGVIGSVISKAVDAALGRRAAERPSSVPAEALAEGANGYLPHAEPAAAEEQEVTVVMPVPDKTSEN